MTTASAARGPTSGLSARTVAAPRAGTYTLDNGFLPELERWWQEVAPTGAILPRQYKGPINAYEVNFVYDHGSRRFNYHVAVP